MSTPQGNSKRRPGALDRVVQACEACRRRKTKCDSVRPQCDYCRQNGIECRYVAGKREQHVREHEDLRRRVETYERLLQRIKPVLDSAGQLAVSKALEGDYDSADETTSTPEGQMLQSDEFGESRDRGTTGSQETGKVWEEDVEGYFHFGPREAGEGSASPSAGSAGSMDHLADDVNVLTVNRPAGYIGKAADHRWLLLVKEGLEGGAQDQSTTHPSLQTRPQADQHELSTYHLDDLDVNPEELGPQFVYTALPPRIRADALVRSYFSSVHRCFPTLDHQDFLRRYSEVYSCTDTAAYSRSFLTCLNIIFAISAYREFMDGVYSDRYWDHRAFFLRARMLSALDGGVMFKIFTLEDVQNSALAAVYLFTCKQTNRCWNMTGHAIRTAYGLGLNLRNISPDVSEPCKELMRRIWYTLQVLETMLTFSTGRPSSVDPMYVSVETPRPIEQDLGDATPSPICAAQESLGMLCYKIMTGLYSAKGITKLASWYEVQKRVRDLRSELYDWRHSLPEELNFDPARPSTAHINHRLEINDLAFRYSTIRMLLLRPCLCQMQTRIEGQSRPSEDFNKMCAEECIESARQVMAIIQAAGEDELPWWCVLHYLVGAETIMMIATVRRVTQLTTVLADMQAGLTWLREKAARTSEPSINRTYQQIFALVDKIVSGNPTVDPGDVGKWYEMLAQYYVSQGVGPYFGVAPSVVEDSMQSGLFSNVLGSFGP